MAFKMKNTPDKMFHRASGEVQQPQLPGVQEPGGYGKNPEAVGKQVGSIIVAITSISSRWSPSTCSGGS